MIPSLDPRLSARSRARLCPKRFAFMATPRTWLLRLFSLQRSRLRGNSSLFPWASAARLWSRTATRTRRWRSVSRRWRRSPTGCPPSWTTWMTSWSWTFPSLRLSVSCTGECHMLSLSSWPCVTPGTMCRRWCAGTRPGGSAQTWPSSARWPPPTTSRQPSPATRETAAPRLCAWTNRRVKINFGKLIKIIFMILYL